MNNSGSKPLVSVCIAAYNAQAYIDQAIKSIQAQSLTDLEIIAVDDGSQDDTFHILSVAAQDDRRIRVFSHHVNRGLVCTRNRCLEESQGEYVAIADSDDLSEPTRIERQVNYFVDHPSVGVLGTDVALIDSEGNAIGSIRQRYVHSNQIKFFLMFGPQIHNAASMYRRSLLLSVGGYSEGYDGGAEDYHLWGKLMKVTQFANVPDTLVRYRKHATSITADRTETDRNIFRISGWILSDYLKISIGPSDAQSIHEFLTLAGLPPGDCRLAFALLKRVCVKALQEEDANTTQSFTRLFAAACWRQAQYQVYADKALSTELATAAVRSGAEMGGPDATRYIRRWLTPTFLRRKEPA